jgi:hypothetical protein
MAQRPRKLEAERTVPVGVVLERSTTMGTNDTNATPEQRRPKDVRTIPEKPEPGDKESLAPPTVQRPGAKDESERPIVNPVTGGAL